MSRVAVSVIIASDRTGEDLASCLRSLAAQRGAPPFEALVVSAAPPPEIDGLLAGWVRMEERNPSARRNRAADFAAGDLLAFLDDDAAARPDWLAVAAARSASCALFGGPDAMPGGSPLAERISDLLISTPIIGSGIPAHERRPRPGEVRRPSDLALCNLFVRRRLFDELGGFDESLGYIGEDSDFIRRAMKTGVRPLLVPELLVFHRRRAFPGSFLAQRFRYRWKTGRLLRDRPETVPRGRVALFLGAGCAMMALAVLLGPRGTVLAAAAYAALTWAASAPIWRKDRALFPLVPFAFLLHHANYWIATVGGMLFGARINSRSRPVSPPAPAAGLPTHPAS